MILRPHHLLCTLGYIGKGYSEDFVKNMDIITKKLSENKNLKVFLKVTTDDICICCPKKVTENVCIEDSSVLDYDKKVLEVFNLEQKEYSYSFLLNHIAKNATVENLKYICGDCSWYNDCKFIKSYY